MSPETTLRLCLHPMMDLASSGTLSSTSESSASLSQLCSSRLSTTQMSHNSSPPDLTAKLLTGTASTGKQSVCSMHPTQEKSMLLPSCRKVSTSAQLEKTRSSNSGTTMRESATIRVSDTLELSPRLPSHLTKSSSSPPDLKVASSFGKPQLRSLRPRLTATCQRSHQLRIKALNSELLMLPISQARQ